MRDRSAGGRGRRFRGRSASRAGNHARNNHVCRTSPPLARGLGINRQSLERPLLTRFQPQDRPDRPDSGVGHNRPAADPVPLAFDVARIAPPRLIGFNRSFHVVRGLFRGISRDNPPVHPSTAGRELRVHVQHPAEVARLSEPERSDGDVRLNMLAVVVSSFDLANVPVTSCQQEFSAMFTSHQGGMAVPLEPHRPERLGHRFVEPVGI